MRIEVFRTIFRHPYMGWVYVSLPDDPRICGWTVRVFHRQLWIEWRR